MSTSQDEGSTFDLDAFGEQKARQSYDARATAPVMWKYKSEALLRASKLILKAAVEADQAQTNQMLAWAQDSSAGQSRAWEATEEEVVQNLDEFNHVVAEMLLGLSFENLLKGLIVQKRPDTYNQETGEFKEKRHDLLDLSNDAGFTVNEEEKQLLTRLTHAVIWIGKYMIPLSYESTPKSTGYLDWAKVKVPRQDCKLPPFQDFFNQCLTLWQRCYDAL